MHFPFFQQIEAHISAERLRVYAVPLNGEAAEPKVTLSRYMLNMALCESLYPALQNCEIALRNAIHKHLTHVTGRADWYDDAHYEQCTPFLPSGIKAVFPHLTAQLERFESIRQAGLTPFLRSAMWDLHQIGEDGYAF